MRYLAAALRVWSRLRYSRAARLAALAWICVAAACMWWLARGGPRPAVAGPVAQMASDPGPGHEGPLPALDLPAGDRIYRDFFVWTGPEKTRRPVSDTEGSGPILRAILIGNKRRAWINEMLVSEGQRFTVKHPSGHDDEWEVASIEPDRVYLRRGTEVIVLSMACEEGPQSGAVRTPQ